MNANAKRYHEPRVELTPEEVAQVRECLAILQRAQSLVDCAAQALCPVRGFANEWSASSKPFDAVKRYWHLVHNRLNRLQRKLNNLQPMPIAGAIVLE